MMRPAVAVLAGPTAAAVLLWLAPLPEVVHALPADARAGGDPADAAVHLVALAAWLMVGWLVLATTTALTARAPGAMGRTAAAASRHVTPALVRRALGGTAALGLAVSPVLLPNGALAAACAPGRLPTLDRTAATCAPASSPASVIPPPAATALAPALPVAARTRTVVAGDTLWGLAAEELDAADRPATASRIAERWPAWWHANRPVIGDDPDLIHIGTVLVVPDSLEKTG